ncbi:MAG: hypothetical protein V1777_04915 [Candidatus Micrarchaeota archaeon]
MAGLIRGIFRAVGENAKEAVKSRWEQHRQETQWNRMSFPERQKFLEERSKTNREHAGQGLLEREWSRQKNEEEERLMAVRMRNFEKITGEMQRVEPEKSRQFMETVQTLMERCDQYRQQNPHLKGLDFTLEKLVREQVQHLFAKMYPESPRNPYRVAITMTVFIEQMGLNVPRPSLDHNDK